MPKRKMSKFDYTPKAFENEPTSMLLKKTKSLVRTDWGGSKDPIEAIKNKLKNGGYNGRVSDGLAKIIKELCEVQCAGSRKRIDARMNEAIHRSEQRGD